MCGSWGSSVLTLILSLFLSVMRRIGRCVIYSLVHSFIHSLGWSVALTLNSLYVHIPSLCIIRSCFTREISSLFLEAGRKAYLTRVLLPAPWVVVVARLRKTCWGKCLAWISRSVSLNQHGSLWHNLRPGNLNGRSSTPSYAELYHCHCVDFGVYVGDME